MKNCTELFYQIMSYPEPTKELMNFLSWSQANNKTIAEETFQYEPQLCDLFSRDTDTIKSGSDIMSDYLLFIKKYARLYRSMPFVSHIYIANSMTFNALHAGSDIDLLIITKPGRLWLARWRTWLLGLLFGISRIGSRSTKKFCLSFYLEQKHENIYPLLLQPIDIYMIFWLAHLVPLYCEYSKDSDDIRKSNKRLKGYLPNHPLRQLIRLGNELIIGNSQFKDVIESIHKGHFGVLCNRCVGWVRKPILRFKKSRLGKKGWGVIISDHLLKFHLDKRKEIALKLMNALKCCKNGPQLENNNL